jgi:hypothetical protein
MQNVLSILEEAFMFEGAFVIVVFDFVKTIHIELPDKTVNFVMSEIFGQHYFLKFVDIADDELAAIGGPINNFLVIGVLK